MGFEMRGDCHGWRYCEGGRGKDGIIVFAAVVALLQNGSDLSSSLSRKWQ